MYDCTYKANLNLPKDGKIIKFPHSDWQNIIIQSTFLCIYLQYLSVSATAMSNWLAEQAVMKEEWRCVSMECGGLWPTLVGTPERLQWYANSLDTRTQVSEMAVIQHCLSEILIAHGSQEFVPPYINQDEMERIYPPELM